MSMHAYELPPDETGLADAVREATAGEVVYLTRNGMPVAAVVSAEAAEYLEALEDAADVIAARRALVEGPAIPADEVMPNWVSTTTREHPPLRPGIPAYCASGLRLATAPVGDGRRMVDVDAAGRLEF